ncbi:MAG: hypothetical protein LBU11_11810 [Zoogloeaceae bacterium]|jgi:hypothetical protein|nr:hypothetical protein [Zoogloeaceae bacterium]
MQGTLLALADIACLSFIALLFAQAAMHKLTDFPRFSGYVAEYKLLPESLRIPASAALIAAELLTVCLLVFPATKKFGATLACFLFLAYGVGIGINLARGRAQIECGCGGARQFLSSRLLLRNAVLMLFASVPAIVSVSVPTETLERIAGIAAGASLWMAYNLIDLLLANGGHMRITARGTGRRVFQ